MGKYPHGRKKETLKKNDTIIGKIIANLRVG